MITNDHDHLVSTFYISRPQSQPLTLSSPEQSIEEIAPHQIVQRQTKNKKTVKFQRATPKEDPNLGRIYKMIKRQVKPSAAVKLKLNNSKSHPKIASNRNIFLKQFQQFFQGFIKKNQLHQELFQIRRSNKRKTTRKLTRFSSEESRDLKQEPTKQQCFSQIDEDSFIKKKQSKLNYHERIRKKISSKIEGIKQQDYDKKIHKIEMNDHYKQVNLDKMLRLKGKCRKAPPKLRIIRSGLPINISEIDPKTKSGRQGLAENLKAKKDHGFFSTLQKNCEVVLSDINNYEHYPVSHKISRHKSHSKIKNRNLSYMKETCSNTLKRSSMAVNARRSIDEEDQSRWRTQFLKIQDKYNKNLKKSRQLNGGIKVFQSYCNFVGNKWNEDQQRINTILAEQAAHESEVYIYSGNSAQPLVV